MKYFKTLAIAATLIVSGCAGLNEGMSDIRYATGNSWTLAGSANSGSANAGTVIAPNSVVLITLQQLYINTFDELRFAPQRAFVGGNIFDARGQIAILVGVPSTTGPSSMTDVKDHYVVFYSNDVSEGQILNFRNQRVFGPTRISDPRFEIDFVVLEIDRLSDQDANLLTRLAEWGQTVGAVGAPGLNVLSDLGKALLAPNDDVEMRYRLTFDLGDRPGATLPMRTGMYALIRSEERDIETMGRDADWPNVCLNRNTARLHQGVERGTDGNCSGDLYHARSYLVLNIETGSLPETTIALQQFSGLTETLRTMTNPTTTAVQAALDKMASSYARDTKESKVWTALSELAIRSTAFGSLPPAACPGPEEERRTAQARLTEQVVATYAAFDLAGSSRADPDPAKRYDLEVYQRQAAQLARYLGPLDWQAGPNETDPTPEGRWVSAGDPTQFKVVFGSVSELSDRLEARAIQQWAPACPT